MPTLLSDGWRAYFRCQSLGPVSTVAFGPAGADQVFLAIENAIDKSYVAVRPDRVCSITNRGPEPMIERHFILCTCQRRADRQFLPSVNNEPGQLFILL